MKDVSKILTKKDYGHVTLKNNSRIREELAHAGGLRFDYPRWLPALFIVIIVVACLGEDKTLNLRFGGMPKAFTLLVPVMAFLLLVLKGELVRFRYLGKPTLMYLIFWAALCLWSVILWVINFSNNKAMTRGIEKMEYQTIAIVVGIAAVYVFGSRTVDYFATGIYIANALIGVIEMPNYGGPVNSINQIIELITTFGDGHGFALAMEIHEVTFLYGMFLVYYLVFAPRDTKKERRRNKIHIVMSVIFMLVGFKRLLLFCVPLISFIAWLIKKAKKPFRIVMFVGIFWMVFFLVYLYIVSTGDLSSFAARMGVEMMGRDYIWALVKRYYKLSPLFLGQGFGMVDGVIVSDLYHAGYIDKAYPLHNDILKVFIEFGFPGLMIWSGVQYLVFPALFKKFFDTETAMCYMALLSLMSTTYITDNTAFYFWCMMVLRMIPLAYGVYRRNKTGEKIVEEKAKWEPASRTDFQQLVREELAQKE